MTLLNWELAPERVLIFSDTLCLDGEDRRPRRFMTKVYPLPHLGAVITGTGASGVVTRFYLSVVEDMVVDDVVHLAEYAPITLRRIWAEFRAQILEGFSTTIYTFGLCPETEQFVGFAFRSTCNFEAEQLQYAVGVKPAPDPAEMKPVESMLDFVELARKQQADDRSRPRLERVGIGGGLWLYVLSKSDAGALSLCVERIEEMAHFDDDHELILSKLPENKDHPRAIMALARDP